MRGADSLRIAAAVAFLAGQVVLVVEAQFGDTRTFCWAPHTVQVEYALEVERGGRLLTPRQVHRRYWIDPRGWESHSVYNLMALIEQRERGARESARVALSYRVNGGEREAWHWPPR